MFTQVLQAIRQNGGATFDSKGNLHTSGVAVAGIAPALKVAEKAFTAEVLEKTLRLFAGTALYGAWVDPEGILWLEPTEVYQDRETAIRIGRQRGEIAVFDLDTGEEIFL